MGRSFRSKTLFPSFTTFVLGAAVAFLIDKEVLKFVAKKVVRGAVAARENINAIKGEILEEIQDEQAAKQAASRATSVS